eukprot:scaffold14015_cov112-Isochrysis_galbana.AAC.13
MRRALAPDGPSGPPASRTPFAREETVEKDTIGSSSAERAEGGAPRREKPEAPDVGFDSWRCTA